jgi:muconate cycloisomerase
MVDANSGYRTSLIAVQELQQLEPYRLQLVEQPIHRKRLAELAFIRAHISTPILADESMRHWPDAYDVAKAGAADALGIYICEAGGMLAALNAAAIGEAAGLVVTIGSQCELGIGTAAMAHAAVCMPNLAFESDITGHLRYPVDIINEQLDYRDGAIHPPTTPGLGVTLNEEVLELWRLDR